MEQVELIEKLQHPELKHTMGEARLGKQLRQEILQHQQDKVYLLIQHQQQLQLLYQQELLEMKYLLLITLEHLILMHVQWQLMAQKKYLDLQTI